MRFLFFLLFVSTIGRGRESDTLLPRILAVKSDTEKVNRLYTRGFALRNSDPQLAFNYGKLCEQNAMRSGSGKHMAKSYNLLGVLYYKKGNYLTALTYHTQALRLREACGDLTGIAHSHTNLGNVYADLQLYDKAERAYLAATDAYKRSGHEENIAGCLLNTGTVKHHLKQYDAAIENYRLAQAITNPNDYNTKAIFLTNMGQAYAAKGMTGQCIACNEDALKLRLMADNNLETGDNYLNLGSAYLVQKDLLKAKYYLDTAWAIACRYDYFELKQEACKSYTEYYAANRDYEAAFHWQQQYNRLNDTIMVQQALNRQLCDFNDLEKTAAGYAPGTIANMWLLITVSALVIFIPFTLIRYKR